RRGRLRDLRHWLCVVARRHRPHRLVHRDRRLRGAGFQSMPRPTDAKVASHHNERRPADVLLGQYSVPFSLAVAAWHDPEDPMAFAADCVDDRGILDLAACIELAVAAARGGGPALSFTWHDARNSAGRADTFRGCPETP